LAIFKRLWNLTPLAGGKWGSAGSGSKLVIGHQSVFCVGPDFGEFAGSVWPAPLGARSSLVPIEKANENRAIKMADLEKIFEKS